MLRYAVYTALAVLTAPLVTCSSQLSTGISQLAMQLSADIEFTSDAVGKNFVWSPYSTHSAFSQVLLGSAGITQAELENVLGISKAETSQYQTLRSSVTSGNATLKIGNLLALAQGFKPKTQYTQQLQSRFNSKLLELDFINEASASVDKINKFVADQTNNKIEDLLSDDQVNDLTHLVLINAVYFKALWKTSFDARSTIDSQFQTRNGPVETPFMTLKIKTHVMETEKYRILELPYQDPSKSLLIVLPEGDDLSVSIMDLIRTANLSAVRAEPLMQTNVFMPKFKIRHRTQLKPLMRAAGIRDVFANSANLSDISDRQLAIDEAVHEAFIEVNEEGTEAAAATGVILGLRSGVPPSLFHVDRPFAFIVYDFTQEVPLFIGKVNNPVTGVGARRGSLDEGSASVDAQQDKDTDSQNVCDSRLENIPNALNNVDLCKQAEDGKMFDWLRRYRSICEESQRVLKSFTDNNCQLKWCEYAKKNIAAWEQEKRQCASRQLDACRTNDNKINAFKRLKCNMK